MRAQFSFVPERDRLMQWHQFAINPLVSIRRQQVISVRGKEGFGHGNFVVAKVINPFWKILCFTRVPTVLQRSLRWCGFFRLAFIVKQEDITALSNHLLDKLEKVNETWNDCVTAPAFPLNDPSIYTPSALQRAFQFFWNSDFTPMHRGKALRSFWLAGSDGERFAVSVYGVQLKAKLPLHSSTRAANLWFPLLKTCSKTTLMFKNKS